MNIIILLSTFVNVSPSNRPLYKSRTLSRLPVRSSVTDPCSSLHLASETVHTRISQKLRSSSYSGVGAASFVSKPSYLSLLRLLFANISQFKKSYDDLACYKLTPSLRFA